MTRLTRPQALLRHLPTLQQRRTYIKPAVRYPDPLSSSDVTAQKLTPNLTFYHRPPPSAPTPYSLTTAPASPLLRPPSSSPNSNTAGEEPPTLKPTPSPKRLHLNAEAVAEIQRLRREDPRTNSRIALSKQFECSPVFVGMVAPLPKEQYERVWEDLEKRRRGWGQRKVMIKEIRKRRRDFW